MIELVVASAFFIAKSENRNQVHYAVQVDEACAPLPVAPVYPYWRLLERGARVTEALLGIEQAVYGVARQVVVRRENGEGEVQLRLAAMQDRVITVHTARKDGVCTAEALTTIGGASARLTSVFVEVAWPFGARSLTVRGVREADGAPLSEVIPR